MFIIDLETLDVESTAVVLSIAILHFDETKHYSYEELVNNCCFVKFDAKEQIEKYKRTVSKETLQWWKSQPEDVKVVSLIPNKSDVCLLDGLSSIKDYVSSFSGEKIVWIRGALGQMVFTSLCKSAEIYPIFPFHSYMELRTGINLLKNDVKRGYCKVAGFDEAVLQKHNPKSDAAYDVMMLLFGE